MPWKFDPKDGMLRQNGRLLRADYQYDADKNNNIPCLLYAGGFNFCHNSILELCPYDSLHGLFFGEEISMAVRLYTHGIDLYAPPQTVCYHLWKRNSLRAREDNNSEEEKQRQDALEMVRKQLRGLGRGLGTVRSAEQFSQQLSVDFEKQILVSGCENAGLNEDAFVSLPTFNDAAGVAAGNSCSGDIDMSSVLTLVSQFMKEA